MKLRKYEIIGIMQRSYIITLKNGSWQYLFLLLIILLFSGCSIQSSRPIPEANFYNLLLKAKDFLSFCIYLANQENPYWNQMISRLYYSYYTLSRIVHIGKTNKLERVKHDIIWHQMKLSVRRSYGEEVKKMRVYYDYLPDEAENRDRKTKEYLFIIFKERENYRVLIEDAKLQVYKFYSTSKYSDMWVERCVEVLKEMEDNHEVLMNKLRKVLDE